MANNVHQHVLRILDDKAISALNNFNAVLREKRIEVQDVTHTKAVTSLKAFNDTISNLELDEPEENANFRRDMRDLRTTIDNDLTTGEFQRFHSNYNSTYDRSEIQYVHIYARKRVQSDGNTVVEYILSRFSHKRFQNEAAKTGGSIITVLGGGIAGGAMLIAGPVGWAVMGFGGASMIAGLTTVAAGRDDKIGEDHKIYIESAILDNLMHNALVRRENNQIVVEFQEG